MVSLDVLIEILSRLSPEPLLRFKSVSKFRYALIDDPKFVAKHLSISLQQKHLHVKRIVTNNSGEKEFVSSILKFPLDQSMSVLDVHFPFHDDYKYLHFFGHSHGLICICGRYDLFLCNLATRQFRKLPPSIILLDEIQNKPKGDCSSRYLISSITGFGYDARSRDFKVVTVMHFSDEVSSISPLRVEIYDMSKDRWREIEPLICCSVFSMPLFNTFHEGKFYWLGTGVTFAPLYEMILTFDISEEVFCQIVLPESLNQKAHDRSLGILNGSVVLFNYPSRGMNEKSFDI